MMNDEKIIKNMLEEAWNNFVKYYDKKALGYSKSIKSREKAKDSHWICWNESDLMVQLGRYFYILLKNNKSISDIEMHFDKFLNSANFGDYIFNDKLDDLKERVGLKRRGQGPRIDLIITKEITKEKKYDPFLLCAEAKCFHAPEYYKKTAKSEIERYIKRLKIIKELGIAEQTALIIFDDYYCFKKDQSESIWIKSQKDKLKDIKVLYHNSRAKIKRWK